MNIKLTFLILGILLSIQSFTQSTEYLIDGEMVIQFNSEQAFQQFSKRGHSDLKLIKKVSDNFQLYLYKYSPVSTPIKRLTDELNQNPLISVAGQNFRAQKRVTIPNDQSFNKQESFDIIQAPEAWDITTRAGDNIVVAVIEGAGIDHEDLKENIWTNPGEIPNDGIDNDNNGYIDDFRGVNVIDSTDTPIVDNHGTSVAGIIGAKGNNGIGVAGVLWDVKMMIVSSELTFPQIIASYDYVYEMRKKYNETNGEEGAYVITTNSSFGVNNSFQNSNPLFPIWCQAYDLMGSVGILSAAAVTNNKVDIGIVGDMPGICPSEYLLTITDTNLDDELEAAYNLVHVDMAAPGESFTTDATEEGYSIFIGTSAATPAVSGSIAMLYSYECEAFQNQAISYPDSTALQIKDIIMGSVDRIEELVGLTASSGRLNLFNAMQDLQEAFGSPKGDLGFISVYPNPTDQNLFVQYRTSEVSDYDLKVYDAIGRLVYHEIIPKLCSKREIEIPAQDFPNGVYFMSIENINNIQSTKFMVNK